MATFTVSNFNGLAFADNGVVSQDLELYGVSGNVTGVSITLGGLEHTYADDLDMELAGPGRGRGYVFWSDIGGENDIFETFYTISDAGTARMDSSAALPIRGTYLPANYEGPEGSVQFKDGVGLRYQAPDAGFDTFESAFRDSGAAGTWTLFVADDRAGETGSLDSWSLTVSTSSAIALLDGTTGADTIRVTSTGFGSGVYQVNGKVPIAYSGVAFFRIDGFGGDDLITGSEAGDSIAGGQGRDTVRAGAGGDVLLIVKGDDVAGEVYDGGAGQDRLVLVGTGSYTVNLRDDAVSGFEGLDFGRGTTGATVTVQLNANQFGSGIASTGFISGSSDFEDAIPNLSDRLDIAMGTATSLNLSAISFGQFGDPKDVVVITGDGNIESIVGANGARNVIDGKGGADTMRGGNLSDTFYVDNSGDRVFENAGGGSDTVITSATYTLTAGQEVELLRSVVQAATTTMNLTGNNLAQSIQGNNGTNALSGLAGSDRLFGYNGADTLNGGGDQDALYGGLGNDNFVFNTALNPMTNVDTVADFRNVSGDNDTVRLDNAVFTKLTTGGALKSDFFTANADGVAQDANDYVIYETDTGRLLYDADGSGAGAAVQFALLSGRPTLTASDFVVI